MTFSIRQVVISCNKHVEGARCFEQFTVFLDQAHTLHTVIQLVDQAATEKGWKRQPVGGLAEIAHNHYCPTHSGQLPSAEGLYADRLARIVQAVDVHGDGRLYWRWILTGNQDIQMGEWIEDPVAVLSLPLDRYVLDSGRRAISA